MCIYYIKNPRARYLLYNDVRNDGYILLLQCFVVSVDHLYLPLP